MYKQISSIVFIFSSPDTYQLCTHNCNVFSDEVAHYLCNASVPDYILELPDELMQAKLIAGVKKIIAKLEASARPIIEEKVIDKWKKFKGS